jgi:hypothetical protein
MHFVLEVVVLECSFLKHSQGILGIKDTWLLLFCDAHIFFMYIQPNLTKESSTGNISLHT